MAVAGVPLSDEVCTSLLIACGKAGQLEAAFTLWSELQQQGTTQHAESVIAVSLLQCSHRAPMNGRHKGCPVLPHQRCLLLFTSAAGPLFVCISTGWLQQHRQRTLPAASAATSLLVTAHIICCSTTDRACCLLTALRHACLPLHRAHTTAPWKGPADCWLSCNTPACDCTGCCAAVQQMLLLPCRACCMPAAAVGNPNGACGCCLTYSSRAFSSR